MNTPSVSRWGFAALGSLGLVAVVACSSGRSKFTPPLELGSDDLNQEPTYDDGDDTLNGGPPEALPGAPDPGGPGPGPGPSPDAGTSIDSGSTGPGPGPTVDSGTTAPDSGGPVTPPSSCSGKSNGFVPNASKPTEVCCGGSVAAINTNTNCGGCGIACAAGKTCGEVVPGEWGCTCTLNADCVAGYGAAATCYTYGGGSFCNCQCPADAPSCTGVCGGGATCRDITGQNYCTYH